MIAGYKSTFRKIFASSAKLLEEARENWGDIHATTIDAVIKTHHREKAHKGAVVRDKKYAPFREYFKQVQKEKFDEALKNGEMLTANGFAHWFLRNREIDMKIPYKEGNKLHKLIRLAEVNNREFKTPIECKNG